MFRDIDSYEFVFNIIHHTEIPCTFKTRIVVIRNGLSLIIKTGIWSPSSIRRTAINALGTAGKEETKYALKTLAKPINVSKNLY